MDAKVEVTVQIKVFRNGMMCGISFSVVENA